MGYYFSSYQPCQFCGAEFKSTRRDAKFCSPKCRTASSRREKKRADATARRAEIWHTKRLHQSETITHECPIANAMISDIQNEHGSQAAADAVELAYTVLMHISAGYENQLQRTMAKIERLSGYETAVQEIKKTLRTL